VEALEIDGAEGDPGPAAAGLAKRIVEPLDLAEEKTRVLVSPFGRLAYVPFALLLPDREVVCVPSGTTYGRLLEERPPPGRGILALGNPVYGEGDLAPLPESEGEAKAVGEVLLLGEDATEEKLLRAVARRDRWRAAHFACHGLVDPESPAHSCLALTAAPPDDGRFTCLDLFGKRIPADLVVLSACETARGKVYRAEGIVGLTRAFMLAGAPRVLCSLWKVDDEATRALMVRFYELWNPTPEFDRRGLPAATALKEAQEFVRTHPDHPEWAHPYYWAAWVLWGLPE
jgi:CHAT domain-containing protein